MAKRFRFNLDPVLRYRDMIEGERMRDFAHANRAVEDAAMRIRQLEDERADTQEDVRELFAGGGDFSQVVEHFRYINTLDIDMSTRMKKLQGLKETREKQREAYVEARRDRRALELLREKRQEEHRHEVEREAQAELDALAVQAKRIRDSREA